MLRGHWRERFICLVFVDVNNWSWNLLKLAIPIFGLCAQRHHFTGKKPGSCRRWGCPLGAGGCCDAARFGAEPGPRHGRREARADSSAQIGLRFPPRGGSALLRRRPLRSFDQKAARRCTRPRPARNGSRPRRCRWMCLAETASPRDYCTARVAFAREEDADLSAVHPPPSAWMRPTCASACAVRTRTSLRCAASAVRWASISSK